MKERLGIAARVLAVVVAIFIPVSVMAWQRDQIAHEACQSLNQYRSEDKAKWEFILSLGPLPKEGTPERDRVDRFVTFLDRSDAQKEC